MNNIDNNNDSSNKWVFRIVIALWVTVVTLGVYFYLVENL